MSGFEIFAYFGSVLMVMIGVVVAIHALKSARGADRRDPDIVNKIIGELNEKQ